MVNGLLMHPAHPVSIIHDKQLIVSKWVYDRGSATKTVYQCRFTFNESDGRLERVIYQVIAEDWSNSLLSVTERELRHDEVIKTQPYFDQAMGKIVEKARQDQSRAFVRA